MSSGEKSVREQKGRRSFPSTLLDQMFWVFCIHSLIDRSIDGDDDKCEERKFYKEQVLPEMEVNSIEDEEVASLKKGCLMEKLMEKKINDKVSSRRTSSLPEMESRSLQDNDPMFFSTSSSSSCSSSGGLLPSSDAEFFDSAKSRTPCFSAARPKPNKANVPSRPGRYQNPSYYEQTENYLFDDYHSTQQISKTEENLIKSKSRGLKIYPSLKKVKQLISPGGRLANFVNSLYTHGNAKKAKNAYINGGHEDANIERKAKSTNASTCSSASSFSRCAPDSREKYDNNGVAEVKSLVIEKNRKMSSWEKSLREQKPRRHPEKPTFSSILLDEMFRSIDEEDGKYEERRFYKEESVAAEVKSHVMEKNRKIKEDSRDVFKGYQDQKIDNSMKERVVERNVRQYEDEVDDDDAASDSSDDLFEIDLGFV